MGTAVLSHVLAQGIRSQHRVFLWDEMPRLYRFTAHRRRALGLPQIHRPKQTLYHAAVTPDYQGIAGNFFTERTAGAVVLQVYARAGAVVLAS